MSIRGALVQIGPHKIDRSRFDWSEIDRNPLFCPDAQTAAQWADYLDEVRKNGSSVGAVVEVVAEGVPAGWGAPLYGKLDADLASAMMSINAVKAVEIGDGFAAAELTGEANADEMRIGPDGQPMFLSNHAGGVLGGLSTGQSIVVRFAGRECEPDRQAVRVDQCMNLAGQTTARATHAEIFIVGSTTRENHRHRRQRDHVVDDGGLTKQTRNCRQRRLGAYDTATTFNTL